MDSADKIRNASVFLGNPMFVRTNSWGLVSCFADPGNTSVFDVTSRLGVYVTTTSNGSASVVVKVYSGVLDMQVYVFDGMPDKPPFEDRLFFTTMKRLNRISTKHE